MTRLVCHGANFIEKSGRRLAPRRGDSFREARNSVLVKSMWSIRAAIGCWAVGSVFAQLSPTAYRCLGQPDLRQNGINRVQGVEFNAPYGMALDARDGGLHIYVADTRNHRVMAWQNAQAFQIGDPPALTLGQTGPQGSSPLGIGAKGFYQPVSLAVDPLTGNLYVADFGNNRVLRFLSPFRNPSRVEPDAVYGQADFNSRTANPAGITRNSLRAPQGVAFDANGNLWVADTGNHRVLRFATATLDLTNPEADLVVGQADFNSGGADRSGGGPGVSGAGFNSPSGLAFDRQNNLYVADALNTRVLKFAQPFATAMQVFGQPDFKSRGVPRDPTSQSMAGPTGVSVDAAGNVYVAVPADNRVLMFAGDGVNGAAAKAVLGQAGFTASAPNAGVFPRASAGSLYGPADVKTDAAGNLYVADTGNNRVLLFAPGNKTARLVWGQIDFLSNGVNQVKASGMNGPRKIVVDYSQTPFPAYVSDTLNHRILAWKDSVHFRNGDPADFVVGQPDFSSSAPPVDAQGVRRPSPARLSSPSGLAVDSNGNLYVADTDNNRVLRFPNPVQQAQAGPINADLVLGQADFTSYTATGGGAASMQSPSGLALGPDGDLFVADTGNNRVLEFSANAASGEPAIRIFGHSDFSSSAADPVSAQSLSAPQGIAVDAAYNLYVADFGANRILIFPNTHAAPAGGETAAIVIGNDRFDNVSGGAGASRLRGPTDVALDGSGNIYVSDTGNNRVLIFPSFFFLPISGAGASAVLGQHDMNGTAANWDQRDSLATADGLAGPLGIYVDRRTTLYIVDSLNNRVLHFLNTLAIANVANPQAGAVAPGSLALLSGTGLADDAQTQPAPLPMTLANRQVMVNDILNAPLADVSPDHISFQLPAGTPPGSPQISVRTGDTGELIAGAVFPVALYAPGLFPSVSSAPIKTLNQDGTANSAANPAARGSNVRIYGTGQGPVSPPVADGAAAPSDQSVSTVAVPTADGQSCLTQQPSVCVAIGNTFGTIRFSGLAPGMVGIWMIEVQIPANATAGSATPVRAVINGTPTNLISVAIK
jgi:uncharacterized protein (TIGR03437 family)